MTIKKTPAQSFEWSSYTGNLAWLQARTIFLTVHGSHAYGTNIATSDVDVKGVVVPPAEYFHGFLHKFEQAESKDPDMVVYDVRKFFNLAADCNPNIIEVLHTADEDIIQTSDLGEYLRGIGDLFLSRKAKHTFSRYAAAQLKRIRTHRRWLLNPPSSPPTRAEYSLPESTVISSDDRAAAEAAVQKQIEGWDLDLEPFERPTRIALETRVAQVLAEMRIASDEKWQAAARVIGFSENFIEAMVRERAYRTKQREWDQFCDWKSNRNQVRAALEAKYGMDTKHAAHLVRLTRMGREILATGDVIVKRPDAEELLSIRAGAWSYDKLVEWAEHEDAALEEVAKTSPLPHSPNRKDLDAACEYIVEEMLK